MEPRSSRLTGSGHPTHGRADSPTTSDGLLRPAALQLRRPVQHDLDPGNGVLPDGTLVYSAWTGPGPDEKAIARLTPGSGEPQLLLPTGDAPRFVSSGYLVYGRLDALFAVPWDPSRSSLSNVVPISLPEHPWVDNESAVNFVLSTTGTLAYIRGGPSRYANRVAWVDRAGAVEPLQIPERDYEAVKLSPDGQRAVLQIREGMMGLWLLDFSRRTLNLDGAVRADLDVGRLQIAMDDPLLVRRLERRGDLPGNGEGLGQRHGSAGHLHPQVLPLDEFHDQGSQAVTLFEAVDLRNIGVVQRGERLRLTGEAGDTFGVGHEEFRQDLDRDVPIELRVARETLRPCLRRRASR